MYTQWRNPSSPSAARGGRGMKLVSMRVPWKLRKDVLPRCTVCEDEDIADVFYVAMRNTYWNTWIISWAQGLEKAWRYIFLGRRWFVAASIGRVFTWRLCVEDAFLSHGDKEAMHRQSMHALYGNSPRTVKGYYACLSDCPSQPALSLCAGIDKQEAYIVEVVEVEFACNTTCNRAAPQHNQHVCQAVT